MPVREKQLQCRAPVQPRTAKIMFQHIPAPNADRLVNIGQESHTRCQNQYVSLFVRGIRKIDDLAIRSRKEIV
ncbi:hypothetical protein FACS1894129_1400 [Actinomycetota bacterium]|nr:hypothetical protein FACS1894129_1400 [Actinomycetota bacterium]